MAENHGWSGIIAIVLAWVLFVIYARAGHAYRRARRENPHSPINGSFLGSWAFYLFRLDPEPEPEPKSDPNPRRGFRLWLIDRHRSAVEWEETDADPEPVGPPEKKEPNPLKRWVTTSVANGARTTDILTEGRRRFGVSESTVKRALRHARPARTTTRRTPS